MVSVTIIFLQQYDGQQGAAQAFLDIDAPNCHIDDFKIWDIEVYKDTAIALVTGHSDVQQSKNIAGVEVSISCGIEVTSRKVILYIKSWQNPASIDIQWDVTIECQCWQYSARIWQKMNYRKNRLSHNILIFSYQLVVFLSSVLSTEY